MARYWSAESASACSCAQALELRLGAHGEDLHHRLDQLVVDEGFLGEQGEDADRLAVLVLQRIAGVAARAEAPQLLVVRVALADAVGEHHERAPDHVAAGRGGERIAEVLAVAVDAVDAERAHFVAVQLADQRELAVQDAAHRSDKLGEHALAARRRGGQRRLLQGFYALGIAHGRQCRRRPALAHFGLPEGNH
jgi:hypothetical protein